MAPFGSLKHLETASTSKVQPSQPWQRPLCFWPGAKCITNAFDDFRSTLRVFFLVSWSPRFIDDLSMMLWQVTPTLHPPSLSEIMSGRQCTCAAGQDSSTLAVASKKFSLQPGGTKLLGRTFAKLSDSS